MGVDPADAADIEWLVLKHLRMSAIAQRRDLSDPDLIHAFAEEVGTLDRLEKLYLLTYADIATVGPRTWTEWKARLLRELFEKTREALAPRRAPARARDGRGGRPRAGGRGARARARGAVAERRGSASWRPCRRATSSPSTPPTRPAHLRLSALGPRPRRWPRGSATVRRWATPRWPSPPAIGPACSPRSPASSRRTASTSSTPRSSPRRTTRRSGAIAGRALDVFQLRGPEERAAEPPAGGPPGATWRASSRARSRSTRSWPGACAPPRSRRSRSPRADQDGHRQRQRARPQRGRRLHRRSRRPPAHPRRTFFELGLSVDLARIATEGHRASDAFYVRTADGARLEGEAAERVPRR